MTTFAFYDGRKAGQYGNVKSANPYRKGWGRLGLGAQSIWADDWDNGFEEGEFLREASFVDLIAALNNYGSVIKKGEKVICV